jgi:hypothetical protein
VAVRLKRPSVLSHPPTLFRLAFVKSVVFGGASSLRPRTRGAPLRSRVHSSTRPLVGPLHRHARRRTRAPGPRFSRRKQGSEKRYAFFCKCTLHVVIHFFGAKLASVENSNIRRSCKCGKCVASARRTKRALYLELGEENAACPALAWDAGTLLS